MAARARVRAGPPARRATGNAPRATRAPRNAARAARIQRVARKAGVNISFATPPVRAKRGRKKLPPRVVLITSFRARGSIGKSFGKSPGGLEAKERARERYFQLQSESPQGFPDSPGIWGSQEQLFLGQVNFPGRVSLKTLFRLLNVSLNLVRRDRVFDFRRVYGRWEYKWQVYERVGTQRRIIARRRASNRTKRK